MPRHHFANATPKLVSGTSVVCVGACGDVLFLPDGRHVIHSAYTSERESDDLYEKITSIKSFIFNSQIELHSTKHA